MYATCCTNGVFEFNDLLVKINCTSDNEQLNKRKTKNRTAQYHDQVSSNNVYSVLTVIITIAHTSMQ